MRGWVPVMLVAGKTSLRRQHGFKSRWDHGGQPITAFLCSGSCAESNHSAEKRLRHTPRASASVGRGRRAWPQTAQRSQRGRAPAPSERPRSPLQRPSTRRSSGRRARFTERAGQLDPAATPASTRRGRRLSPPPSPDVDHLIHFLPPCRFPPASVTFLTGSLIEEAR
jgi:hypothetical protein